MQPEQIVLEPDHSPPPLLARSPLETVALDDKDPETFLKLLKEITTLPPKVPLPSSFQKDVLSRSQYIADKFGWCTTFAAMVTQGLLGASMAAFLILSYIYGSQRLSQGLMLCNNVLTTIGVWYLGSYLIRRFGWCNALSQHDNADHQGFHPRRWLLSVLCFLCAMPFVASTGIFLPLIASTLFFFINLYWVSFEEFVLAMWGKFNIVRLYNKDAFIALADPKNWWAVLNPKNWTRPRLAAAIVLIHGTLTLATFFGFLGSELTCEDIAQRQEQISGLIPRDNTWAWDTFRSAIDYSAGFFRQFWVQYSVPFLGGFVANLVSGPGILIGFWNTARAFLFEWLESKEHREYIESQELSVEALRIFGLSEMKTNRALGNTGSLESAAINATTSSETPAALEKRLEAWAPSDIVEAAHALTKTHPEIARYLPKPVGPLERYTSSAVGLLATGISIGGVVGFPFVAVMITASLGLYFLAIPYATSVMWMMVCMCVASCYEPFRNFVKSTCFGRYPSPAYLSTTEKGGRLLTALLACAAGAFPNVYLNILAGLASVFWITMGFLAPVCLEIFASYTILSTPSIQQACEKDPRLAWGKLIDDKLVCARKGVNDLPPETLKQITGKPVPATYRDWPTFFKRDPERDGLLGSSKAEVGKTQDNSVPIEGAPTQLATLFGTSTT